MPVHRFVALVALLFSALVATPLLAQGADGDPGDEYFRAYLMNNDGDRLVQSGELQRALDKFEQAQSIFDSIATNHPKWQASMLSYRRQKLGNAIEEVKAKLSAPAATPPPAPTPVPAPVQPAPAPVNAAPAPVPGFGQPLVVAPITPVQPSGDPVQDALETLRRAADAKANAANQQLTDALSALGRSKLEFDSMFAQRNEAVKQRDQFYLEAEGQKQINAQKDAKVRELEAAVKVGSASKADLEKARKELEASKEQLAESKERLAKAESSVMSQSQKFAESEMKLEALQKERDTLKADVAKLLADNETLKKQSPGGAAGEQIKKLIAENDKLKQDLATAQQQVDSLRTDLGKRDAEIGQLKGQLTKLQSELTSLRQENAAFEAQVADLTLELKKIRDVAKDPTKSKEQSPELMAENQLLRSIIARQLRIQARQQEQKRLIIDSIQKTESASKDLIDQVEQLASARLSLSPDEQKLFTTPQLQEIMGSEGIKGTLNAKGTPDAATKADPKQEQLDALVTKGNRALEAGKLPDAEAAYADALRADPKSMAALVGLAWSRLQQGKLDEAEATLNKAIEVDEKNAKAHYMLGVAYFRRDKLTEALKAFDKSLTLDAKNARARHYLGVIASKMGLGDRAEREFKQSLAIDPNYGDADFNLAVLYATGKPPNYDAAKKHYEDALKKGVKPDSSLEQLLKAPATK